MAQTALEWFINGLLEANYISKDSRIMNQFIKQAKKMEKQQIKDAFDDSELHNTGNENCSEIYYNYTYKK